MEIEIVLHKVRENFVYNLLVRAKVVRPDEDVIEIDCNFAFCDKVGEDSVHECLEGSREVGKSEVHNIELKEPAVGDEHCFSLVSGFNPDIVITPTDIKLCEHTRFLQLVDNVVSER